MVRLVREQNYIMNDIKAKITHPTALIPKESPAFRRPLMIEEPEVRTTAGTQEVSQRPTHAPQHLVPPAPPPMTDARDLPQDAANASMQASHEALRHYECIIEQSLAREDERDAALLAIHDQKLYKLTHASFAEYLRQRWEIGRAHV